MGLLTIAQTIRSAKCPEDVFGIVNRSEVVHVFRRLVADIHPDRFQSDPKKLRIATEALELLTSLKGEAERKFKAGIYGNRALSAPPEKAPFTPVVVETKSKKFILTDLLCKGDVCDIYLCTYNDDGLDRTAVFKVVQHGSDNDLVENEAKILTKIYPPNQVEEKFYRLLPRLLDSFVLKGPGSQRRVNILPWFNEHHSLERVLQVHKQIDFRDMVWMFKRTLMAVGFAHEKKNVVHGALIPPHIMIHPLDHGAKILGWSYAVHIPPPKAPDNLFDHVLDDSFLAVPYVRAISAEYRDYYAPEILKKSTPTAATDIYMAARCATALVTGNPKGRMPNDVPKEVRAFFLSCLADDPKNRPQNAWDAHEDLDIILKRVVGPNKYRPFAMPE